MITASQVSTESELIWYMEFWELFIEGRGWIRCDLNHFSSGRLLSFSKCNVWWEPLPLCFYIWNKRENLRSPTHTLFLNIVTFTEFITLESPLCVKWGYPNKCVEESSTHIYWRITRYRLAAVQNHRNRHLLFYTLLGQGTRAFKRLNSQNLLLSHKSETNASIFVTPVAVGPEWDLMGVYPTRNIWQKDY